ncbi:hypothetical protein ACFL5P_01130, partial [candidate division KSB1 bacterium]
LDSAEINKELEEIEILLDDKESHNINFRAEEDNWLKFAYNKGRNDNDLLSLDVLETALQKLPQSKRILEKY